MQRRSITRHGHRLTVFILVLLVIEFLDEFIFGAYEAGWPLIRDELGLSYEQVGLVLSVPAFIASLIEPGLGILGDVWKRKFIVMGGGVIFTLALVLVSLSDRFALLLLAFILFYPASGAFVSLSQATLMDIDPHRHNQNMARWTFAGSAGVVGGALTLGGLAALGWGWRELFFGTAIFSSVMVVTAARFHFPNSVLPENPETLSFITGVSNAIQALRRKEVIRWLTLLEFSDLMLDVLHGYLALYFTDVVGVTEGRAALAVAVWAGVGLIGDFLLIPLLEHVRGLTYLRLSAVVEFALFPAFLVVPGVASKLIVLAFVGLFNAGWYSILKGQLYSSMPGQSGTVMAVGNISGLVGSLIPLGIGVVAGQCGLDVAIWLILLGPIALLIGIPHQKVSDNSPERV